MNPKPPPPSSTQNPFTTTTTTATANITNSKMEESKQQQQLQQQQAAIARFPSNIDAHLRPLGSFRPINIPPNPNPIPNPIPIPNLNSTSKSNLNSTLPNPNLTSQSRMQPKVNQPLPQPPQLQLKVNQVPSQPQPALPVDVWRVQSQLPTSLQPKRSSDAPKRDTLTDDAFFTVRDRKVRISDRNAIYALCRSWLRNGYREESQLQPQPGDVFKSLPKPLPLAESSTPERKETADERDGEEENAAGTSSAEELLQRHIKRAKRVRERLKEERMRRIKRYKSRLKLLLPPPIEQCRGDTGPS